MNILKDTLAQQQQPFAYINGNILAFVVNDKAYMFSSYHWNDEEAREALLNLECLESFGYVSLNSMSEPYYTMEDNFEVVATMMDFTL